jgi:putative transposase
MIARKPYPSDLSDAQWQHLLPLIPAAKPGGRPRTVDIREIINGILYITRGGNDWRMLPHDFPPWETVYYYFRRWQRDGTWEMIHDTLRERVRVRAGREATPSAAILDSQSVKTTEKGGHAGTTVARKSMGASVTCS